MLQSTTFSRHDAEIVLSRSSHDPASRPALDYFVAFSPERIDPGRTDFTVLNTPKVVGGLTPRATDRAVALLGALGAPVHPVSSPKAAEMTKLLENIFRSVNIALVNELACAGERMGIDMWEVINAAKTKPFGYMPFSPSAGVGGHCIGVDPYYLSWKAREYDFYTKFIELAGRTNTNMPRFATERAMETLNKAGVATSNAEVAVLGVSYKPDVGDLRESPALEIMEQLTALGATLSYHDPHVPELPRLRPLLPNRSTRFLPCGPRTDRHGAQRS